MTGEDRVLAFLESWGDHPQFDKLAESADADDTYHPLLASDLREVLSDLHIYRQTILDAMERAHA